MNEPNTYVPNSDLIRELRRMAGEGTTVLALTSKIEDMLEPGRFGSVMIVYYLHRAFGLGVHHGKTAASLFCGGMLTAEEIDAKVMPQIMVNRHVWDQPCGSEG